MNSIVVGMFLYVALVDDVSSAKKELEIVWRLGVHYSGGYMIATNNLKKWWC